VRLSRPYRLGKDLIFFSLRIGDDLKEIGVTAVGHRRILREARAGLSNEKKAGIPAVSPAPVGAERPRCPVPAGDSVPACAALLWRQHRFESGWGR
jgi:hypothetical protein